MKSYMLGSMSNDLFALDEHAKGKDQGFHVLKLSAVEL